MPEAPPFPVLRLPAQRLARAYSAVFNAAGTERDAYHLWRAVTVEVFTGEGGGVRLICANGSFLLRTWVPQWSDVDDDGDAAFDEPDLSVQPEHTIVVSDNRKRGLGLLKSLAQPPKEGEDDGRTDVVELTVGRVEHEGSQLTLEGLGETWGLLITSPREQVCPPLLGSDAVIPWRHVYDSYDPASVDDFEFDAGNLRALSAVGGRVQMIPQGDNRPFLLRCDTGHEVVWGVLMPCRKPDKPADPHGADDEGDDGPFDDEADDVEPATDEDVESFLDELGR